MLKFKVFTLVCLFIIRLRFLPSKSIASILRERYGEAILKDVRRLEKVDLKKRKAQLDINFLERIFLPSKTRYQVIYALIYFTNTRAIAAMLYT